MSSQEPFSAAAVPQAIPNLAVMGDRCPTCDQHIPHDRFEEIQRRIETRQSARAAEIADRLKAQFAREKADALSRARLEAAAAIDKEKSDSLVLIANARSEERLAVEAASREALIELERTNEASLAALQIRISEAEAATAASDKTTEHLSAQIDQLRRENEADRQRLAEEAKANEVAIRAEAENLAKESIQEQLSDLERIGQDKEASLRAQIREAEVAHELALQHNSSLHASLEATRTENEAAALRAQQEADARVETARRETTDSVKSDLQESLSIAAQAKVAAEFKTAEALGQLHALEQSHASDLVQQLTEQRDILERAQADAVNAEKSSAYEEKQKLAGKVEELQRALENKTAEELGEGAEIDLYEVLRAEFDGDRIERINKGQPGADILHVVIHNGKPCGTIIYDSKNHNAWRNEFIAKLASDQMAVKAEHAVLSTRKFPAGTRHLHVQDGVIVAAPSRVLALIQIIRQHILQTHTLRLSGDARAQKTTELYRFVTSQRCTDLFLRIDTHTDDLLEIQVKEKRAHENMWKRQGELIRSVQKVRAEISTEIEAIIGTAAAPESAFYE